MTNDIVRRSAKSAADWTMGDLGFYNIILQRQDAATFFGTQDLPQSQVEPEILNIQNASDMTMAQNQELINLLDLAMIPTSSLQGSAVNDFTVCLFRALHYNWGHRVSRTHMGNRLFICNEWRQAKIDVCLLDHCQNNITLVVQEDKGFGDGETTRADAEAQLIAQAVAAFSWNNRQRYNTGQPLLEHQIIPGIVMTGTLPTFFKIPVTLRLVAAIGRGQLPYNAPPTYVHVHFPDLPRPNHCRSEGMKPLDNRQQILKCYEAFKTIIGI